MVRYGEEIKMSRSSGRSHTKSSSSKDAGRDAGGGGGIPPEARDILKLLETTMQKLDTERTRVEQERKQVQTKREHYQQQLQEASRLRDVLQKQTNALNNPFLWCCGTPTNTEIEAEAQKAVRKVADKATKKAFQRASERGDTAELTIDDLREIEGDKAEEVMRLADTDGGGTVSLKEYRVFKKKQALEDMNLKKSGFKANAPAPLEDMCDATYKVGQHVLVLRSDENWHPCDVVAVDCSGLEPFYIVQLENGSTKDVQESDLSAA